MFSVRYWQTVEEEKPEKTENKQKPQTAEKPDDDVKKRGVCFMWEEKAEEEDC